MTNEPGQTMIITRPTMEKINAKMLNHLPHFRTVLPNKCKTIITNKKKKSVI